MNKSEQKESAPKFKEEGKQLFLDKKYDQAGVSYEKALKCIGKIIWNYSSSSIEINLFFVRSSSWIPEYYFRFTYEL